MLDQSYRLEFGPVGPSVPADFMSAHRTGASFGIRAFLDRFAGRRSGPGDAQAAPAGHGPARGSGEGGDPALRARAQAACRAVSGAGDRALDPALGVMEAEILRLRDAVQAYGETLKSIEVYAADDTARAAARAALRTRPRRLHAAPSVPRLAAGRADRARSEHG